MDDPARTTAAAFSAAVAREGLVPDPELRLLGHLAGSPPEELPQGPADLGPFREQLAAIDDRTRRGAWYTPRWLADELVTRAVDPTNPGSVLDPSCGGGVFLLATADALAATRSPRRTVEALRGIDLDPLAVEVTEAALWWWSARRGEPTVAGPRLQVADALLADWPRSAAVVGNPPFLGQLRQATATTSVRRAALRDRFGDALRPYTDEAWLFLLAAVRSVAPGGRVALLQPQSLIASRDAAVVRREIDDLATLRSVWIDPGGAFDAAVDTCAPVLERGAPGSNDWSRALADAVGVPTATLESDRRLGDVASVSAGFRDEYYGLVGCVHDGGDGPRLVTSGLIDPLRVLQRPVRFAKARWDEPRLEVAAVEGRAREWITRQLAPKLMVATQTRILEGAVDPEGSMVAGVPSIVVRPHDPADLWPLAAALHAPSVSAWLVRRTIGTGLGKDSCRPTAGLVAELPLPTRGDAWRNATVLARSLAGGGNDWDDFARVADAAYGVDDPDVRSWWLERLPVR